MVSAQFLTRSANPLPKFDGEVLLPRYSQKIVYSGEWGFQKRYSVSRSMSDYVGPLRYTLRKTHDTSDEVFFGGIRSQTACLRVYWKLGTILFVF